VCVTCSYTVGAQRIKKKSYCRKGPALAPSHQSESVYTLHVYMSSSSFAFACAHTSLFAFMCLHVIVCVRASLHIVVRIRACTHSCLPARRCPRLYPPAHHPLCLVTVAMCVCVCCASFTCEKPVVTSLASGCRMNKKRKHTVEKGQCPLASPFPLVCEQLPLPPCCRLHSRQSTHCRCVSFSCSGLV
jgi:hypothetical protein